MRLKIAALIFSFCLSFAFISNAQLPIISPQDKFGAALNLINNYYVDTVNTKKLTEYAIIGMLKELDPHSSYMSEEEMKKFDEPMQGSFDGIGVQFNILNDTIEVIAPINGGPSEKLGILAGDKIVKIEGKDAAGIGITNEDVIKQLRGKKGTEVSISILRRGTKKLLEFKIVRDKIPIYSLDAAYMATPEIGYIKLNRFAATTNTEFKEGLSKLKQKGMKDLILDLRGNSGGYLNTAIDLCNEFLEEKKLIVYTEGINSPKNESYSTAFGGEFRTGKLVILIDRGSASASEIVSGAMQDWDRAIIIGQRSFGKGLVQKPFRLPDGSTLKLTIAKYFTPSGRCIQIPYGEGVEKYYKALTDRMTKGELFHADSVHFPDSLKFYTSNKRVVYGGGGVMPDIFVPIDTSKNSTYYIELWSKGVFNTFSLEYVDRNREELKKTYPDFESFKSKFIVDKKLMTDFVDFAEKKGAKKDDKGIKTSEEFITNQIRVWIARQIWVNGEYLEILNNLSPEYKKAIEVIQDDTFNKMNIRYK